MRLVSGDVYSVDNTQDATTVYGYGAGNSGTDQTSKTVYAGLAASGSPTETTTFTYDAMGRTTGVSIVQGGTTTAITYAYDANDFRVEQSVNGVRTIYLCHGAG